MAKRAKVRIVSRSIAARPEVELEDSNADPEDIEDVEVEESDDDETTDTESVKATKAVKGDSGAQQILEAFGGVDFLTALVADTDVRAILDARRKGAKTKVVLDGEAGDTDAATEEEDAVDDVVEELDDDTKKIVKALRADIKAQLKPLADEVSALKGIAGAYQKEAVNTQIKTVAKKFKDFPKYQKQMAQLARDHPGLAVQELYVLAKSQAGALRLTAESTESERPTPTPRRRAVGAKRTGITRPGGRKEFQNILASALDNIEFVEE